MLRIVIKYFYIFINLFKETKAAYKKDVVNWGNKNEMVEEVNCYMYNFVQELDYTEGYIEK